MTSAAAARRHLEALAAEPRPSGGAAERRARAYCAQVLSGAGMEVREEAFEFSAWPGRWATPTFGSAGIAALLIAAALGHSGRGLPALSTLVGATVALGLAGFWVARHGVTSLGLMREQAVNLMAVRGEPAVWLVAHLDSKSQPVPILLRAGGIALLGFVWLLAIVIAAAQTTIGTAADASGAAPIADWWPWIGFVGAAAAVPVIASLVSDRSPGALDNASGVATVLLVAEAVPDAPLGILLTGAEELGLAGARQWARPRAPGIAINCDGVDDRGTLAAMYSGRAPRSLLDLFARASAAVGVPNRSHRLLPGILVDGVALADAGWQVITITRGTVESLRRIHTKADDLGALTGTGVANAANVMQRMARDLTVVA